MAEVGVGGNWQIHKRHEIHKHNLRTNHLFKPDVLPTLKLLVKLKTVFIF